MTVVETRPHAGQPLVRSAPKGGLRTIEIGGKPGIQLQILRYNVVDSFGTLWLPGCLTKSLGSRMPQLTWGHKWEDMIGRAQSWRDTADGPIVDFRLDDFEDVPRARQAYSQVRSGTVDDCSVGFAPNFTARRPTAEELRSWPGCIEVMEEADLDETALVLRGAVPGAKVLNFRQRGQRSRVLGLRSAQVIDSEIAARIVTELMAGLARGEGDLLSALEQLRENSVAAPIEATSDAELEPTEDTPVETGEPTGDDDEPNEIAATTEQPEEPEVTDPAEGDRVTEDTEVVDQTATTEPVETDTTPEPVVDLELDQTMADIDNLLAEREAI